MKKILVIGASGFVGSYVARALLADGYTVRCLVRNPAKVQDLATAGCEIVQGDMADPASMQHALESMDAVYVSIHTLSPQTTGRETDSARQDFMDLEMTAFLCHDTKSTARAKEPTAVGNSLRGREP